MKRRGRVNAIQSLRAQASRFRQARRWSAERLVLMKLRELMHTQLRAEIRRGARQ